MNSIPFKVTTVFLVLLFHVSSAIAQPGTILNTGDSNIHYKTYGTGTPVLILNGGPGMSSEGFIPLARELSKKHQTIIYDQRGTGLSSIDRADSSSITMDLMVDDIEILREHLNIEEWVVMGHSFGGMLAYYYASKHPQRVSAMIQSSSGGMDLALLESLNITAALTETERDSLAFYTAKINSGDTSYETLLKRGQFLAPAYLYDTKHVPVVAERLTQGNSQINSLIWQDLQRIGYDTKEALKSFEKPVLIIHGAEDIVGTDIAETAYNVLPNSRLVILERCRHYGWLDRRDTYFSVIERFLTSYHTIKNEREIL